MKVTAIINAHREGSILRATLNSAAQSLAYASSCGLPVELIIVLDSCDDITRAIAQSSSTTIPETRILETSYKDLGKARNHGVGYARGDYVAFLDGDDLWGKNWIAAAYEAASQDTREVIWHPELSIYFGHHSYCFRHIDCDDKKFDIANLALTNYWTALCFARREFLLKHPYPQTDFAQQIGFEDWGWNLLTLSSGAIHKVVVGSAHAIRSKEVSLVKQTQAAGCMTTPSDAFKKDLAMHQPRAGTNA